MATVTRSNPQGLKQIALNMKELDSKDLKVGWFPDAKYEDGTPVAYVASINEFGPHARPFMRPTATKHITEWLEIAQRGAKAIVRSDETAENVMDILGQKVQEDIKQGIVEVNAPPLSKITLMARKYREQGKKITGKTIGEIARLIKEGHYDPSDNTKPLIETKHMIQTVDHVVEDKK